MSIYEIVPAQRPAAHTAHSGGANALRSAGPDGSAFHTAPTFRSGGNGHRPKLLSTQPESPGVLERVDQAMS